MQGGTEEGGNDEGGAGNYEAGSAEECGICRKGGRGYVAGVEIRDGGG